MAQLICPQCGSKYLKCKTSGDVSIITVNSEFHIEVMDGGAQPSGGRIDPSAAIRCGACSWSGIADQLQTSDLEL